MATEHVDPPRILIVEDNPANLDVLIDQLAGAGFTIMVAGDGEEALERSQYKPPDLILLDVLLPGIDGFETCRRLKADDRTRTIPVIFITALTDLADKIRGFAMGGVDFVTKPLQEQEVLARVKTHLALHQLQQQIEAQNAQLQQEIAVREQVEAELQRAHAELELRVEARTFELRQTEEEIQRRNRELALLNRIIAASVSETQPEAILEIACRELAQTFNVPQTMATLLNEEQTESRVVAEYLAPGRPSALAHTFPMVGNPALEYMFTQKMPLVVDDAQSDPRMVAARDLVRQRGSVSLLALPLVIDGEMVGGLTLSTTEARPFSTEEVGLAWSVANQVAGVLARLRLDQARKRLEAQFLQAQKMDGIGRLAGGVAHDFNNLLTAIIGYVELACDMLAPDDPLYSDLRAIRDAADRATALTRQLLAFARKQVLDPQVLDLSDLVLNLDKLLRRLIGEDIELVVLPARDLWPVKADANQLEQVLVNLAINARDAMFGGGKLTIETANVLLDAAYAHQHVSVAPGPYVRLTVSDTGVGMAPEVQARLFEPFFTTKEAGKGTGLGLATCYGIVKQHGGHIWVYSELGHGTVFKVYLPRTTEMIDARPTYEMPASMLNGSETVLLVEDEAAVRQLAARVLRQLGYTVLEAGNGVEALQAVGAHAGVIDLLLTDVMMPELGGAGLVAQLRERHLPLKVLFMSGYTENAVVHHSMLKPGIAFLQKPFTPDLLARKVREVLAVTEGRSL